MQQPFSRDAKIPLLCSGCGAETESTVGWLMTRPESFVCSGCGQTVPVDREGLEKTVAEFEELERTIESLPAWMKGKPR